MGAPPAMVSLLVVQATLQLKPEVRQFSRGLFNLEVWLNHRYLVWKMHCITGCCSGSGTQTTVARVVWHKWWIGDTIGRHGRHYRRLSTSFEVNRLLVQAVVVTESQKCFWQKREAMNQQNWLVDLALFLSLWQNTQKK